MYELVIIGAGPAGITAAIYAIRKRMNFAVITGDVGGQTNWTKNIENYTGFQLISGEELMRRFREHLEEFHVEVREGERAANIEKQENSFKITTSKGVVESKSVIIASGMTRRMLGVPGEAAYLGKGVAYCANCDAPLFRDMNVAVIGGGNSALDAVLQLDKIASKIYLIDKELQLRADPILREKMSAIGKLTLYGSSRVTEIHGDKFVKGITIDQNGTMRELAVEGVMIEIGFRPSSDFAALVARNDRGEIIVNHLNETSIAGIFAAGDVTNVPSKQIIVACGEGAKAAIAAFTYIN